MTRIKRSIAGFVILAADHTLAFAMVQPEQNSSRFALDKPEEVFQRAANLFRIMSAPMRLKIISCLCDGEKNVSYLLSRIETTQPNMSQHLTTLYQAGILGKRREGVQIFYCIADERIVDICRAVCGQIESQQETVAIQE